MTCTQVSRLLPGYLDGALPDKMGPHVHLLISQHLEGCPACRHELECYRQIARMTSSVGRAVPPPDLGERILQALSKARATGDIPGLLRRCKNGLQPLLANILEPLALSSMAGVLVALLVFAMIYQVLGAGMPLSAATPDSPTNLLQPARLEVLAGFQISRLEEMSRRAAGQHPLLVEAMVSADGQASSYRILSGQVDSAARHELDQVVLFSRFRPQMSFGRPTSGGRVILSFSQIRVRG